LEEGRRARALLQSRQLDLFEASLRTKAGDFEGAVAFLQRLQAEDPDDVELLYSLGVVYGEAGRIEDSLRIMHQVVERNRDHAGALNYIGYTWAEQGENLEQAEALIVRALEIRPEDGYITDSLGWVYYMKARPLLQSGQLEEGRGLLERAVRELERAAELTGGDPVIAEHLGDAYRLLDDRRRALEMYEEALSLEPRPREQPNLREKLENLRQELDAR
jgi:tetratricopeptide (TPR) repeat protein